MGPTYSDRILLATLGLHLDDIREVLTIRDGGTPPCDTVRPLPSLPQAVRACPVVSKFYRLLLMRGALDVTDCLHVRSARMPDR